MTDVLEIPETMLAVRAKGPDQLYLDPMTPVPAVRRGYLLIRVLSVALNPSDNKRLAVFQEDIPHTIGCDVAGCVVSCGEDVGQDYKPGDRVAGLCYSMKPGDPSSGAFGQYALLKSALSMLVPGHVSDAEAATIALVKALGADEVFDYHDAEDCGPAIRAATNDALLHCLDCIATGDSQRICAEALTSRGSCVARYTASLPIGAGFPRQDVRHGWTSGYSSFGEETHLSGPLRDANVDELEFATHFWKLAAGLLWQDRIRLGPLVHLRQGGLQGVPEGLSELKSGYVSAGKLVYIISS
ncbi:hypothetical protein E8E14_002817 [Neopestalotiopsis sp. 37M]|nr:hypothetical protein E8E14_002817 [Neopestalotiopsis sp. 37M]